MSAEEPLVFLRGEMVPASQAHIAIYDSAIVLGATVTDLLRTFRHKPYRMEDHVARFFRSCKYARIRPPLSPEEMMVVSRELIQHNACLIGPNQELAVVYFISPGEFRVYAGSAGNAGDMAPTLCIHSFPLPFQVWSDYFTLGIHVVTPSVRHVPPQCVDPKIKCRSRMHYWLADQETHLADPKAVTLLLDLDGNVTETSGANFLIVRDGTLIAPSPRNILRGISMTVAAELCEELGIPHLEQDFQVYDVINAEEALLATTPYCLAPVTRINGVTIGEGRPGPVFNRLMQAWSERVGLDILEQIRSAGASPL